MIDLGRFGKLAASVACGIVLSAGVDAPSFAGDAAAGNQLISCVPKGADTASVTVVNLRIGIVEKHVWARATVHLTMRDGSVRDYAINGRADQVDKELRLNEATPGFSYPGFACTVNYAPINSVQNCRGGNSRRACDVGVQIFGLSAAFSVSMTATRVKVREAAATE